MSTATPPEAVLRRQARRRREVEARRDDVVAGATSVFAEKGYHEAQMTEIAAAAGLSLAGLYGLFEGKEAIYQEVMRRATRGVHERVQERVAGVAEPSERALVLVDGLFECFEENRELLRILLSGTHGLPWHVREKMGDASKEVLDGFYEWIRSLSADVLDSCQLDGVTPEALTAALVGTVTNLAAWSLEQHPERSLTEAASPARALVRAILGGATQ